LVNLQKIIGALSVVNEVYCLAVMLYTKKSFFHYACNKRRRIRGKGKKGIPRKE
jgi:hypothetical protein